MKTVLVMRGHLSRELSVIVLKHFEISVLHSSMNQSAIAQKMQWRTSCVLLPVVYNVISSLFSACPPKTFKPSGGNYHCSVCGANVVDGTHPRTKICQCKAGYLRPRAYSDAFHVNCEGKY